MCGISGYASSEVIVPDGTIERMTRPLTHRGPSSEGVWAERHVALGNRRLAVLDLSARGHQPMVSHDGRYVMTYNGEVYNYVELKGDLRGPFESGSDTEVVLEAFARWGVGSFERLNGMFAMAIWDRATEQLYLVRDRFGVKPLYYTTTDGALCFASEIKSLAAAGIAMQPDLDTWSKYLLYGAYDDGETTFFKGIHRVPPGHYLVWQAGRVEVRCWYDLPARIRAGWPDERPAEIIAQEYLHLLNDAVSIRFRSDVPVGVCLSGGLDSSTLVALLKQRFGPSQAIQTYHFACGDEVYDEIPWVRRLLSETSYPLNIVTLAAQEVPHLAEEAIAFQEEPFGGIPTLAMVQLFKLAKSRGTTVLLDGQGLDEQWAGYSYYALSAGQSHASVPVQGSIRGATSPTCVARDFAFLADQTVYPQPFGERLLDLRYRDLRYTKLPRALRFNDRASSQASCELREPFLDYRLVEMALSLPERHLIHDGQHKYLLRQIVKPLLPTNFSEAPKRPVQTPQREWLRGPLRDWVEACLDDPGVAQSGWFDIVRLRRSWEQYLREDSDSSYHIWQWISVALNRQFLDSLTTVKAHS